VREHGGRVRPAQAVLLQLERPQDRGGRGERVERAEPVGHEPGVHLERADRAADHVLGLEDAHLPARVGQDGGGDQAVVTAADDDGVDV
jgi:hypothetical protein